MYRCSSSDSYISTVEQMTVKNPGIATDAGCQNTPVIFCPALTSADASQLTDGMGTTSGDLNYIYIRDFFSCGTWFEYVDAMYPSSTASVSFDNSEWCASSSNGNTGNNNNRGSGDKTQIGSDSETKPGMSGTALAILWTACGIFIIFCIVAISYYVYKWREKKLLSEEQNVALTEEKEEDKFENDDGMVGDEDNTAKDVVV